MPLIWTTLLFSPSFRRLHERSKSPLDRERADVDRSSPELPEPLPLPRPIPDPDPDPDPLPDVDRAELDVVTPPELVVPAAVTTAAPPADPEALSEETLSPPPPLLLLLLLPPPSFKLVIALPHPAAGPSVSELEPDDPTLLTLLPPPPPLPSRSIFISDAGRMNLARRLAIALVLVPMTLVAAAIGPISAAAASACNCCILPTVGFIPTTSCPRPLPLPQRPSSSSSSSIFLLSFFTCFSILLCYLLCLFR